MLSLKYLVLALAAMAEAGKLYGCAGTCIGKAITATGCSSSNSQCICSSVLFMETIKDCSASDCTEAQTESAMTVAEEFCNLIGDDTPGLTHEKRGGRGGYGRYRGGHGHGRPGWQGNGASGGQSSDAPTAPAGGPEFPNWSAEGERIGAGGEQGGGRPGGFEGGFDGGRFGESGQEGGGGRFGGRPGGGAPPPEYTPTASYSTPSGPEHTQAPPAKHPQPPAPAHSHSTTGLPTTTARPTWTTSSAPEHTVW